MVAYLSVSVSCFTALVARTESAAGACLGRESLTNVVCVRLLWQQATVLDAMVDACCRLVPGRLTTPNMMRALEYLVLAMDELVDGGTILEIDSGAIVSRVSMKSTVGEVCARVSMHASAHMHARVCMYSCMLDVRTCMLE